MKFLSVFYVIIYVFIFFNPKFTVTVNGIINNGFLYRVAGATFMSLLLTLFIGLPIFGIISLFK